MMITTAMTTKANPMKKSVIVLLKIYCKPIASLKVLVFFILSKELHYKVKMMIGLVAHDLYSRESSVSYQQRLSFDVLMSAIDWPVSFKEITLFAPSK